jgi:hypothetical protein
MAETVTNRRRIDRLKAWRLNKDLPTKTPNSSENSAKLLPGKRCFRTYGIPLHPVDTVNSNVDSKAQSLDTSDWTNDASFPVCNFTPQNSTNFLEWVDFGQLIALVLASAASLCWLCLCGGKSIP